MTPRKRTAVAAILPLLANLAAYADNPPPPPPGGTGGKPDHGALEAALKSCETSVSKDANGRPERSAMHACMQAKGFPPPPPPSRHGPGDGKPPPPPPQN